MRILLVEDDPNIAMLLAAGLRRDHYSVDVAVDGTSGEDLAAQNDYDLLILDRMLPGKEGLDICRDIRAMGSETPVLILTARNAVQDRIDGLDCGADDYLAKPFAFDELRARVRALLRRQGSKMPQLTVADLVLDPATRIVTRAGQVIELTPREFALLEYLMRHPGKVLRRQVLSEHVWENSDLLDSNVVNVYINYLRQKVDKGHAEALIHTIRGIGYSLRHQTGDSSPSPAT